MALPREVPPEVLDELPEDDPRAVASRRDLRRVHRAMGSRAILLRALRHGRPQRVYHAVDDSDMRMADYFDAVADACGLPRPPRLPREQLREAVSPMMLSFMSESRRLQNRRIVEELGMRLRYPTVAGMLSALPLPLIRDSTG